MAIDWLPPLVMLNQHGGDWDAYCDAVYRHFCRDFLEGAALTFRGLPVHLKRHPVEQGKEATFWHFVSEGQVEADRTIDLRRCERICWPRALIENVGDPDLKVWDQEIRNETRTHVWCEEHDYLLVIAHRNGFVLPWTAYSVTEGHERRKLQKRWQNHR